MQAPSTLLMMMVEAWALMPDCWLFAPATAGIRNEWNGSWQMSTEALKKI